MAKKIDASLAKKLKSLKITASTEEAAREKLLAILEREGVEGMEDEDTDTLIDMVDSFVNDEDTTPEADETEEVEETEEPEEVDEELEEETDEEKDADDLAEEVAEEEAKDEAEDEEPEEEETDETEEVEEEVDEEPEEEEKPKKSTSKKAPKPAKKETPKKEEPKKATKKPVVKEEKKSSKRGKRLDPKNVVTDRKEFDVLKKLFDKDYTYAWLSGFGVTVKHVGKNSSRGIATIDNCMKLEDGNVRCNLYLLTMTKQTDKLDDLGLDYGICWSGAPCLKGTTLEEAVEILEKLYDDITSFVTTVDKRLGDNRKKMEESLKNSGKKTAKTAAAKKAKK